MDTVNQINPDVPVVEEEVDPEEKYNQIIYIPN